MKTIDELYASGLRGKALNDALWVDRLGFPPPPDDLSQEERSAALEQFFSLIDSMSDEELKDNPLAGRPLNVSILDLDDRSHADAA